MQQQFRCAGTCSRHWCDHTQPPHATALTPLCLPSKVSRSFGTNQPGYFWQVAFLRVVSLTVCVSSNTSCACAPVCVCACLCACQAVLDGRPVARNTSSPVTGEALLNINLLRPPGTYPLIFEVMAMGDALNTNMSVTVAPCGPGEVIITRELHAGFSRRCCAQHTDDSCQSAFPARPQPCRLTNARWDRSTVSSHILSRTHHSSGQWHCDEGPAVNCLHSLPGLLQLRMRA